MTSSLFSHDDKVEIKIVYYFICKYSLFTEKGGETQTALKISLQAGGSDNLSVSPSPRDLPPSSCSVDSLSPTPSSTSSSANAYLASHPVPISVTPSHPSTLPLPASSTPSPVPTSTNPSPSLTAPGTQRAIPSSQSPVSPLYRAMSPSLSFRSSPSVNALPDVKRLRDHLVKQGKLSNAAYVTF